MTERNKSKALFAVALLISVCAALPVRAMPILAIDADPGIAGVQSALSIASGASFEVDILVSGLQPNQLAGFDITLLFDPSVLNSSGVASGGLLAPPLLLPPLPSLPPGTFQYSELSSVAAPALQGTLATVTFQALSAGVSALDFAPVITALTGPFGSPVVFEAQSATITVDGSTSGAIPVPATFLLIAVGLLGISVARKSF